MCINKTATAINILFFRLSNGENNIQRKNKMKRVPNPLNDINHCASDTLSQWVEVYMYISA